MTRLALPIAAILGFLALVVGAMWSGDPEASFTFGNRGHPVTLDPAQMTWMQDTRVAWTIFEGLCGQTPEEALPTDGVAHYPPDVSADGLTYTFHLRPEARWSNGDPVTAQDFAYAWRRAIEPGTAGDYVLLFLDHIRGAKEYNAWRNEAVAVLTAMRDLSRGRAIERDAAQRVAAAVHDVRINAILTTSPNADWTDTCAALIDLGRGFWSRRAASFLEAHLAEMDERYAKVGWHVLDDHTFQVDLIRPTAYFNELAAYVTFMPVHRESLGLLREITPEGLWVYDNEWPKPDYHKNGYPGIITNGPYRLVEWRFKRYLLLERNPYYWNADKVSFDTVKIVSYDSQSTAFLAFEQGRVDLLIALTAEFVPELMDAVRAGQRDDIHWCQAYGTYYYNFNCRPRLHNGQPNLFLDRRIRQALDMAIDKKALVDRVVKRGNKVATTLVPPGSIPGYTSPAGLGYDPERARALLAEAGYPGGVGFPEVEILMNTAGGHEPIAQVVSKMWQDTLGIRASIRAQEVKTFNDARKRGEFTVARFSWYGDYLDPTTFLDLYESRNGNNDGKFNNPTYDGLLRKAAATIDPAARMRVLSEAEKLLVEDEVPLIPLYHYVNVYAYRPELKGIYPNVRLMNPIQNMYFAK